MTRPAYTVIAANVEALPEVFPSWLIGLVDAMARTRDALFETEQGVSVVVGSDVPGREKAERCARIAREFSDEHGARIVEWGNRFASKRKELPPEVARSFGAELAVLLSCVGNLIFRGHVLARLGAESAWTNEEAALGALRILAEHSPGQGPTLDWIRTYLIGTEDARGEASA